MGNQLVLCTREHSVTHNDSAKRETIVGTGLIFSSICRRNPSDLSASANPDFPKWTGGSRSVDSLESELRDPPLLKDVKKSDLSAIEVLDFPKWTGGSKFVDPLESELRKHLPLQGDLQIEFVEKSITARGQIQ